MKGTRMVVVALLAALMGGCSTMGGVGDVFGPSQDFSVTICAEGVVAIPCRQVATVSVPEGGEGLLSLVVALAGPYLARTANLESCLFTAYPEAVGKGITVTGSAACLLNGVPAQEKVTISFVPFVAPPA